MEIIDCGKYGYINGEDCFTVMEWNNGWKETGLSFEYNQFNPLDFCEKYTGYNLDELLEELPT